MYVNLKLMYVGHKVNQKKNKQGGSYEQLEMAFSNPSDLQNYIFYPYYPFSDNIKINLADLKKGASYQVGFVLSNDGFNNKVSLISVDPIK